MTALATRMTAEEFLALPEDGKRRWLINGELHEEDMTTRNRYHAFTMSMLAHKLWAWLEKQPKPYGEVISGDATYKLVPDNDSIFGVDVAYNGPELLPDENDPNPVIHGIPRLMVEILSPSNKMEDIDEKVEFYLDAGVALVWLADPQDQTVTSYRPGKQPTLVNNEENLTAQDILPGFSVAVKDLFNT